MFNKLLLFSAYCTLPEYEKRFKKISRYLLSAKIIFKSSEGEIHPERLKKF
jgi:hypothetical protein